MNTLDLTNNLGLIIILFFVIKYTAYTLFFAAANKITNTNKNILGLGFIRLIAGIIAIFVSMPVIALGDMNRENMILYGLVAKSMAWTFIILVVYNQISASKKLHLFGIAIFISMILEGIFSFFDLGVMNLISINLRAC